MALTSAEKAQIREVLGYPAPPVTDTTLEGVLTALADESTLTRVRALLTEVTAIDTQLTASRGRFKVGEAEGVTILGPRETAALNSEGRRLSARLAITLNVVARSGPYGSGGGSGGYYGVG